MGVRLVDNYCSTSSDEKVDDEPTELEIGDTQKLSELKEQISKDEEDKDQTKEQTKLPLLPQLSSEWEEIHKKHLIESLQSYQYLNDLKMPENAPVLSDADKFSKIDGKKLLVFDMDETLLHCIPSPKLDTPCDVKIPYRYHKMLEYKYVNLRPYVVECLLELSKLFQIVVFTASTQDYADPLLNYLDKDYKLIQKRFYRHH